MPERSAGRPVEGAMNLRDLGGLPTVDGRVTAAGKVFRSEALDYLSDAGALTLTCELGIRLVIDLRAPVEGGGIRPPWAQGDEPRFVSMPLDNVDFNAAVPLEDRRTYQARRYLHYLEACTPTLIAVLKLLAEAPDAKPTVIHCAAGKDRTGVAVAMLLGLLGVGRDTIVADYVVSQRNMDEIMARQERVHPYYRQRRTVNPIELYRADAPSMEHFLDLLDERYGGASRWASAQGFAAAALDRLRAQLLEPAGITVDGGSDGHNARTED